MCVFPVASLIEREAVLAKRVRSTPERIELENYRVTLGSLESDLTEEPEEVPEETLANHNLSLLVKNTEGSRLDTHTHTHTHTHTEKRLNILVML